MSENQVSAGTYTIDWLSFHRDVQSLADILKDLGPFERIIAVSRGGLVPAALLARMMELRLVDTICVSSYDDRVQRAGEPVLLKGVAGDGRDWLVVDDLADSGNTLSFVRKQLPLAHFATVYAKPLGAPLVDSVAVRVPQDQWLVFPWDQSF